jgi:hypothetical protein
MQKVEGSSPFSRSRKSPAYRGVLFVSDVCGAPDFELGINIGHQIRRSRAYEPRRSRPQPSAPNEPSRRFIAKTSLVVPQDVPSRPRERSQIRGRLSPQTSHRVRIRDERVPCGIPIDGLCQLGDASVATGSGATCRQPTSAFAAKHSAHTGDRHDPDVANPIAR